MAKMIPPHWHDRTPASEQRVFNLLQKDPATADCPTGSWSLNDLALTILKEAHHQDLLRDRRKVSGNPRWDWPASREELKPEA